MNVERAIAEIAAHRVRHHFSSVDGGAMLRVRGLSKSEIAAFVPVLQSLELAARRQAFQVVVVAHEAWEGIDPRVLLPPDRSATSFRNESAPVVFLEAEDDSDAQSLRNVRTVTDRELLEDGGTRLRLVAAMRPHAPESELLQEGIEKVFQSVPIEMLSLRRWARFVGRVLEGLQDRMVVDEHSVWRAVGDALPEIRLFPEDRLAEASVTRRLRFLRRNASAAGDLLGGRSNEQDDRLEQIEAITFVEEDGTPTPDRIRLPLVERLRAVLGGDAAHPKGGIPFRYWEQAASRRTARTGLGTRIREHLAQEHLDREHELLDDLVERLDAEEAGAAVELLDTEPPEGEETRLSMLLTPSLRNRLEKMADPPQRSTTRPLRKLLEELTGLIESEAELGDLDLKPHARRSRDIEFSAALFAWLYGPTLQVVEAKTRPRGRTLHIDPQLLDPTPLQDFIRRAENSNAESDETVEWDELRLQVLPHGKRTPLVSFEWRPKEVAGLLLFARCAWRGEVTRWSGLDEVDYSGWVASAAERTPLAGAVSPEVGSVLAESFHGTRRRHLEALRDGLRPDLMMAYVEDYLVALESIRDDHVPRGERDPAIGEALLEDCFMSDAGELVMLPTHPIRQRWIADLLEQVGDWLVDAVQGQLKLNEIDGGSLFFRQVMHANPSAQPALLTRGDHMLLAVREDDWAEHFAVVADQHAARLDWLVGLDDNAIDEVASTIQRYVQAYPHKADGLHLLFMVRERGTRSVNRLIDRTMKQLRKTPVRYPSLRLSLIVVPSELEELEQTVQRFDKGDGRSNGDFPQLMIELYPWRGAKLSSELLEDVESQVDIAIVPNLFGAQTTIQEGTSPARDDVDFHPLFDTPTRLETPGDGARASSAVSRRLLPEAHDRLLEAWSTVNTRQRRRKAVASEPDPGDVDHIELQVPFGESSDFFYALHELAHWVVTVDAFVGREQIDALPKAPDVILVRTGIGDSDAYRMVVSSKVGRRFVVNRLARRLGAQLPDPVGLDLRGLASELYQRARLLVPGTVLRSLGLGRTAAELVGLVCARLRVEETFLIDLQGDGFEAWLSLDEHADWVGGIRRSRADLARIVGVMESGRLHVRITVVEAKMRNSIDVSRADEQLDRSVRLFRAALASVGDFKDVDWWRREFVAAIEQSSVVLGDRRAACRVHHDGRLRTSLAAIHSAALRCGEFVIDEISGILVSLMDAEGIDDDLTPMGFRWLRQSKAELQALLERLLDPDAWEDSLSVPPPTVDSGAENSVIAVHPVSGEVISLGGERGFSAEVDGGAAEEVPSTTPREDPGPEQGGETPRARERYQKVIDVLSAHGAGVVAFEGGAAVEGPGFYVFRLGLQKGQRPGGVTKLKEELKYGLALAASHQPRIYVDRGAIVIEVPKRSEERFYVDADDMWGRTTWRTDSLYAPLGVDVRGEVVGVEFSSSRSPHLLIGGMTGGGKTVALETLLWGLLRQYDADRLRLWLVDPKGNEFVQFEEMPHVHQLFDDPAACAIQMLEDGVEEMERRYKLMMELSRERKRRVGDLAAYNTIVEPTERLPWIVVVLDEFADLTSQKDARKEIEGLLQRLAQKARACGIHCIVATQKPSAEVISTTTRSNLGAQLALRVRSAIDSRVVMEVTGAESLAGNGDAFLRLSGEDPTRLQCARVEDSTRRRLQGRGAP